MNHPRHPLAAPLRQTSAADGMLRRAFTVAEVEAMVTVTRVHRRLGAPGYLEIADLGPGEALIPAFAPELALRLTDLGLSPFQGEADHTAS